MDSLAAPTTYPVEYPDSHGEWAYESDWHAKETLDLFHRLQQRYRDAPEVYVSAHMFVYYEEGNPGAMFSPDVMVVFGVPQRDRPVYKLWEEGEPPTVVFEISSKTTWATDKGKKLRLYAELGVQEYFLFDPLKAYLDPPLEGYRLAGDLYVPIVPGDGGALRSARLGIELRVVEDRLAVFDTTTGQRLLGPGEEAAVRRDLERENARLRAEVEWLRQQLGTDA
jgi:Uma2 family endonuclease